MMTCMQPFVKDDMSFPCGRCIPCLKRRASGWSFRLMREERVSDSSFFVTYTYDTEYVPITNNGFMSLDPRHWTLYMKTIRNKYRYDSFKPKIKYFVAGEYGSKRMRPHYHAIIFNADLKYIIGERGAHLCNLYPEYVDGKYKFYPETWPYGNVTVGYVTGASVGYALKYMMKQNRIPLHVNDDRVPEFQRCSKGLGISYLTDAMRNWHRDSLHDRMYVPIEDGKKIAMPRYYKNKLYSSEERQMIGEYVTKMQELENVDNLYLSKSDKVSISASLNRRNGRLSESF